MQKWLRPRFYFNLNIKDRIQTLIGLSATCHSLCNAKGQFISECLFGTYLQFLQKTNNKIWLYYYGTLNQKIFVRFLGELKTPKRHLEINWPENCVPQQDQYISEIWFANFNTFVFHTRNIVSVSKLEKISWHCWVGQKFEYDCKKIVRPVVRWIRRFSKPSQMLSLWKRNFADMANSAIHFKVFYLRYEKSSYNAILILKSWK